MHQSSLAMSKLHSHNANDPSVGTRQGNFRKHPETPSSCIPECILFANTPVRSCP